ncbi:MAG: HD domain-containing protein [Ignavibacteria bacterium]|jgi:putative hydrolase of HD superfamily|nr:HD domain-containing protein [Ignavibacteria bacterium]
MKLNQPIANELFRGFYIERWNDRVRQMPLAEMDKHGHKLIIAYTLGKYEEMNGCKIDWNIVIQDSIFELLRRIVISDIKSPIYQEIKKHKDAFNKLNQFVYSKFDQIIENDTLKESFYNFLFDENDRTTLTYRVIDAAHIYASFWEFQVVKCCNPFQYQNAKVEHEIRQRLYCYSGITGIDNLLSNKSITNFIDLCGQLRFQIRWAQTPRVPKTTVLGHMMYVAALTYLLSLDLDCCDKRMYNNFFGALFHDLPEVVTRDIISPVKRSSENLDHLITQLEHSLADMEIFPYLEPEWEDELKYWTQDEFTNKIVVNDTLHAEITSQEISDKYNTDKYLPYDGELIRFADQYAAYMEAKKSIEAGITAPELVDATVRIKEDNKNKSIANIKLGILF